MFSSIESRLLDSATSLQEMEWFKEDFNYGHDDRRVFHPVGWN